MIEIADYVSGDDGTKNHRYEALSGQIDSIRGGRGVIYIPLGGGGDHFGQDLEEGFVKRNIDYIKHIMIYDKRSKRVLSPKPSDISKSVEYFDKKHGGSIKLLWDDTIASGESAIAAYKWLLRNGVQPDDIHISAYIDRQGLTNGLCAIEEYEAPPEINKLFSMFDIRTENPSILENFMNNSKIAKFIETAKNFFKNYYARKILDLWGEERTTIL